MLFRSLTSLVLVTCFAASVKAEEFRFSGDIGLRPIGEPARKPFVWEPNVGTAFAAAKELDVPMVVVFTLLNDVHSTNFLVDLGADGLTEFADKAVFVHVAIPADGSAGDDPQGMRLVRDLKLTMSPTVSVIAPNPLIVNEAHRIQGHPTIQEFKQSLARGMALALTPEMTWRQTTIEGLVSQLSNAMRSGDLSMYTACLANPMRSHMDKLVNLQFQIGKAKRRLLAALDAKFGVQSDRLDLIEDDEKLSAEFRNTMNVELLRVVAEGERTELRVQFTKRDASGMLTSEERQMIVVRDQLGLLVASDLSAEWVQHVTELIRKETPVVADLDRLAEGVESGMYAEAQTVLDLAKRAYNLRRSAETTAKNE